MRAFVVVCICTAALASAESAQAAQRFAAPAGTGEACTQQSPCSIETAVNKASSNDEVIVTAGAYIAPTGLFLPLSSTDVYVHGDLGGSMPTISSSTGITPVLEAFSNGDRVAYLGVSVTAENRSGLACGIGTIVERVTVTAVGKGAGGIQQSANCVVRDSVVRVDGENSRAVAAASASGNWTSSLRNVTAIATGTSSIGVLAEFFFIGPLESGSQTADLQNVIAHGDGFDLRAVQGINGPGKIVVGHSNFVTSKGEDEAKIADAGGNQTTPPLFVNAGAGDYREAAGSPTIDAGVADQLGSTDLAGNPRTIGAAPDIGAYEFVPTVAPPAQIQSLAIVPKAFRAADIGGAIVSRKKGRGAAIGAKVTYSLSANGTTDFTVERRTVGRKGKGKCVKKTRANAAKKHCALLRQVKGSFTATGTAGQNRFTFSGRLNNKALKPGAYRLVGSTSAALASASFKIVK